MSQRFQIEDLVVQDSSGVVFRALDTETNQTVAVRRFFPFGANGGGLQGEEQTAYQIAVERLSAISHPALRAVICGGCDPIDGMPYIATEWIEGPRLRSFVERGPLGPAEATALLGQALEVCELLSEVLAEEAVWVETDLESIVVGAEGSGRGITFWISPLKWLGKNDGRRGLESMITLTEEVMHWSGKVISDQSGNGLGAWLKWLRGKARTTSLHEAREMLAASIGSEPPVPAKNLVRQAKRAAVVPKKKKKPSRAPILIAAIIGLAAVCAGGWELKRRYQIMQELNPSEELTTDSAIPEIARLPVTPASYEPPSQPAPGGTRAERVTRNAAEMLANNQKLDREKDARRTEIQARGDLFEVADREFLLEKKNLEVKMEGRLAEVRFSGNGNGPTLYLEFSKDPAQHEPRGYIMRKDLTGETTVESLRKFVGKSVRLHGKVTTPNSRHRPEIEIKNLAAIQEVK